MKNLIIISQIQRSGGTLLSQLFDGHPECSVFPGECMLLKGRWPFLKKRYYERRMFEADDDYFRQYVEKGYLKSEKERARFEFDFEKRDRNFRPGIFPSDERILKSFFKATFEGWTNYTGNREGVYMTFSPGLITDLSLRRKVGEEYFRSGSRMITVLRDPASWYLSARGHSIKYQDDCITKYYIPSVQAALGMSNESYKDHLIPIMFTDLTQQTEDVMKYLSARLGIAYDPCLLIPTFNGEPLWSDASYNAVKGKVDRKEERRDTKNELDWELAWLLYDKCKARFGLKQTN